MRFLNKKTKAKAQRLRFLYELAGLAQRLRFLCELAGLAQRLQSKSGFHQS